MACLACLSMGLTEIKTSFASPPQISNASELLIAAQPGQQTFFLCVAPVQGLYLKCKEQTVSYTGAKSRSLPLFLCCGGQLHLWFYLTPAAVLTEPEV